MGDVLHLDDFRHSFHRRLYTPDGRHYWDAREVLADYHDLQPGWYSVKLLRRTHGLRDLELPKGYEQLPFELRYAEEEA